ncbi:MAG: hypothetical protein LBG84_02535 [Treponema sp.]|nr:hypothetical protein [Treponema sp.]
MAVSFFRRRGFFMTRAFIKKIMHTGKFPAKMQKILFFLNKGFALLLAHIHPLFPQSVPVVKKPRVAGGAVKTAPPPIETPAPDSAQKDTEQRRQSQCLRVIQPRKSENARHKRVPEEHRRDAKHGNHGEEHPNA